MTVFKFIIDDFKLHKYREEEKLTSLADIVTTPPSETELIDLNGWMQDKGINEKYKLICEDKTIRIVEG